MDQFTSSKSLKWIIFPAPSMADSAGCLMCGWFRHFWKQQGSILNGDVIKVEIFMIMMIMLWEVIAR